jgi:hypothetical protein
MFFMLFAGCASFKPVDLNPRVQSGQLVQKTDNFVVLFDKSASMGQLQGKPMVNETTRLNHAKATTKNMIATMPAIKMDAGLRTLWSEETARIYGMQSLVKEGYMTAIDTIEMPYGRTPMAEAITAAGRDFTLVVMTESSTYSPALDCVRVDAQAAKAAISIRITKQWITIFLFFMAITPLCTFELKRLIMRFFLLTA